MRWRASNPAPVRVGKCRWVAIVAGLRLTVTAMVCVVAADAAGSTDAREAAVADASSDDRSGVFASGPVLEIVGDTMPVPLTDQPGDPARGRAIVADRRVSLCLLCHQGPLPEPRMQGNVGPPLDGAGTRWSEAQLRLRIVDARALNSASVMPSYHRPAAFPRVARVWTGKPVLDAQQIEDVVAWLLTLK